MKKNIKKKWRDGGNGRKKRRKKKKGFIITIRNGQNKTRAKIKKRRTRI